MEELGAQLLDACLSDLDHAAWLLRKYENQNLVNWRDMRSNVSILHLISYHNLVNAAQLLLSNGADPNSVNKVYDQTNISILLTYCVRTEKPRYIG